MDIEKGHAHATGGGTMTGTINADTAQEAVSTGDERTAQSAGESEVSMTSVHGRARETGGGDAIHGAGRRTSGTRGGATEVKRISTHGIFQVPGHIDVKDGGRIEVGMQ